jgi:hypothetical protein
MLLLIYKAKAGEVDYMSVIRDRKEKSIRVWEFS